ncbi:MinD/ParA family ATP-binding protein [Glaciihabitans sp. GrIS 2.15]|uniref:MinD/ParA family ATP-binding protein n=1 Tax=Glaciihabitans sp. GrIS 2.15 TaxID=3071710 RepID=UPI002E09C6C9|nr:MinD-like ATPase involved in chromosome partitioning or flagellar assembly [Glaciihabitans sp. GrIS 2.15]
MSTRSRESESRDPLTDPKVGYDFADAAGDDLTVSLPQSLTIEVSLPTPVHAAPDDELAVSIVEVPVNPGSVEVVQLSTMSIAVVAPTPAPEPKPEPVVIPELPTNDERALNRRDLSRRERARGDVPTTPEVASMLTAERLIDARKKKRVKPEGGLNAFLYVATLHIVNRGDSPRVLARKAVEARVDKKFEGGARFIPVLTRKGGVGKTTITALLGMALSDIREDRIIAIDANPDRGTLSERVNKQTRSTVRDVVTLAPTINSFNDFTTMVSRDETRLDILASDTDPLLSEAFDENDYNVVADLAARFYSIVLTDCGTGIVHSVMRATLQRADSVVIVSGGSVDEARLASETLTWLEANGYQDLVKNAVVALNTATQGTNLVKLEEIEAHFKSRVREIVRIPYDPQLAAGSVINYRDLKPLTKASARELAALVADGLPARQGA